MSVIDKFILKIILCDLHNGYISCFLYTNVYITEKTYSKYEQALDMGPVMVPKKTFYLDQYNTTPPVMQFGSAQPPNFHCFYS